jgi:hypothetical protein
LKYLPIYWSQSIKLTLDRDGDKEDFQDNKNNERSHIFVGTAGSTNRLGHYKEKSSGG